mmetsp:Transcript_32533/g.70427  ORF Transcript_32533/g.70427 Transcript_32533/m.70427 type:complete len:221 (+) Transcript_32533:115-777(+)|eukprot:CAMPEP_0178576820 /NCGR_PEP_ID=MMETSP0697-20121206/20667_1 /TAXON_ID=265572 /ORGANISM="Extubocellulus spinifer, Strain CCMP396" /LENGTH=220 /DNA_ID=CAMNT_0020212055 /DNA_START=62 /DNA_END=724 /DNA_ORIENTATION=-
MMPQVLVAPTTAAAAASSISSRIHTVLCRTSKPENAGSVARSLRAMGMSGNLILLSPQFELFRRGRTNPRSKNIHPRAKKTASGAVDILRRTRIVERWDGDVIGDCSFVVGATSRPLTENLERQIESSASHENACMNNETPIYSPREYANMIVSDDAYRDKNIAVVFGPEHGGLSDDELDKCHAYLTIPTNPEFPSLNLAMAVQIWAYEVRMATMYAGSL